MPFRILTVCTGNICRSPQAEQLLRAGFERLHTADSTWQLPEISSAGTHALLNERMPQPAADLSREFGGDPSNHSPRQLTRELVDSADLILALAREHRSAVAKLSPAAARKTFTLRELARILAAPAPALAPAPLPVVAPVPLAPVVELVETPLPPTPFEALLHQAQLTRGLAPGTPDTDDVIDPYRRSEATYRRSADQIAPAIAAIIESMGHK